MFYNSNQSTSSTIPSFIIDPSPSSSSSSSSPSCDSGVEFEVNNIPPTPYSTYSKWPFRLFIAACIILYYRYYTSRRDECINSLHENVISCIPDEIQDLISCLNLTTQDLDFIYQLAMRRLVHMFDMYLSAMSIPDIIPVLPSSAIASVFHSLFCMCCVVCRFPRGYMTLDEFGLIVAEQVKIIKIRREKQRLQNKHARDQSRYIREREEVELELLKEQHPSAYVEARYKEIVARNEQMELNDIALSQQDDEERIADEHKDNAFVPLDIYLFFRTLFPGSFPTQTTTNQQQKQQQTYSHNFHIQTLMYGMSLLINDHVSLECRVSSLLSSQSATPVDDEHVQQECEKKRRNWNRFQIEMFTRDSSKKLQYIWQVIDQDKDG